MADEYGSTLTIESGDSESNEILLQGGTLLHLRPDGWTTAGLFLKIRMYAEDTLSPQTYFDVSGSTWDIQIDSGTMTDIISDGRTITFDPALTSGVYSFTVCSGEPGTEVNQGADRTIEYRASKVL